MGGVPCHDLASDTEVDTTPPLNELSIRNGSCPFRTLTAGSVTWSVPPGLSGSEDGHALETYRVSFSAVLFILSKSEVRV